MSDDIHHLSEEKISKETEKLLIFATENKCALVWSFFHAPKDLKLLCHQGGDEDHLIFCPNKCNSLDDYHIEKFATCTTTQFKYKLGDFFVTTHS